MIILPFFILGLKSIVIKEMTTQPFLNLSNIVQ